MLRGCWNDLKKTGILDHRLINRVFSDMEESKKQDLLHIMEGYGLIAGFEGFTGEKPLEEAHEEPTRYLVPAQLTSRPGDDLKELSSDNLCPLYFTFPSGFIPHGLFHQLICKIISTCRELGCVQLPLLHYNLACFHIGNADDYAFILVRMKKFMKVGKYCYKSNIAQPVTLMHKATNTCGK